MLVDPASSIGTAHQHNIPCSVDNWVQDRGLSSTPGLSWVWHSDHRTTPARPAHPPDHVPSSLMDHLDALLTTLLHSLREAFTAGSLHRPRFVERWGIVEVHRARQGE